MTERRNTKAQSHKKKKTKNCITLITQQQNPV